MIQVSEWLVPAVLRASAGLAVAALLVAAFVRLLRLRSPRVEEMAWMLVLIQGIVLRAGLHPRRLGDDQISAGAVAVRDPAPGGPGNAMAGRRAAPGCSRAGVSQRGSLTVPGYGSA